MAELSKTDSSVNLVKRELALRELSRRHLLALVLRLEPEYQAGWVHREIAASLERFFEAVVAKRSPRLMLQVPPRIGKSTLASLYFPAYALGKKPDFEIILCSYSLSLALEFSRKVRGVLRDPRYGVIFDTKIDPERQNAEGWRTTNNGGLLPAGVGGAITGRGADILIIDDPVKNAEEAESQTIREATKDWYRSTAYTRLSPGGGVLLIQTRWHLDDLAGWLESESDGFEVIRYPMIATEDEPYRKAGEPLDPVRWPLEEVERIREAVGPRAWSALYQQNPVPEGGQYFQIESLKYYDSPPTLLTKFAAFDLAVGKGDRNDYTVGIVAGLSPEDDVYILDMVRGRWDAAEIVEQILGVQRRWAPTTVGIEHGAISLAIGPFLSKRIQETRAYDLNITEMRPGRNDKIARARAIQGRIAQGKVLFPRAPWMEALLAELSTFPAGRHDDIVDALAYVGVLLAEIAPPRVYKTSRRRKSAMAA